MVRQLRRQLPGESLVYAAVEGAAPVSAAAPAVRRALEALSSEGPKLVVVASNRLSASFLGGAPDGPQSQLTATSGLPVPVFGIIGAGARATVAALRNLKDSRSPSCGCPAKARPKPYIHKMKLGLVAAEETLAGGVYVQALVEEGYHGPISVFPCGNLDSLVESGELEGGKAEAEVAKILQGTPPDLDGLLVASTYAAHLNRVFEGMMGEDTMLIDPAGELALEVAERLAAAGTPNPGDRGRTARMLLVKNAAAGRETGAGAESAAGRHGDAERFAASAAKLLGEDVAPAAVVELVY